VLIVVVLIAAGAGFLLLRGDDDAKAVRSCLEKAGATVQRAPHAKQVFPYALALGSGERVEPFPGLDRASVYGIRFGRGEALLFFAHDSSDARRIEETLVDFGARGGVNIPTRRAGKTLLVWTVPVSTATSWPLDSCIE
jgi:hypothetical protein